MLGKVSQEEELFHLTGISLTRVVGKPQTRSEEQGARENGVRKAREQSMSVGYSPEAYISKRMSCSLVCEQVGCSVEKEVSETSMRGGYGLELRCSGS